MLVGFVADGLRGWPLYVLVGVDSLCIAPTMNEVPGQSLLEELDARQDELLVELDRLNESSNA